MALNVQHHLAFVSAQNTLPETKSRDDRERNNRHQITILQVNGGEGKRPNYVHQPERAHNQCAVISGWVPIDQPYRHQPWHADQEACEKSDRRRLFDRSQHKRRERGPRHA